jgi:hypothetical protein
MLMDRTSAITTRRTSAMSLLRCYCQNRQRRREDQMPINLTGGHSETSLCHSSDYDPATQWLQLLGVANISQHTGYETNQLVELVKSLCLGRCNVLDPALESPSLNIRFWSELDDESRLVLPSFHQAWTIVRACVVSHKPAVKFP